MFDLSKSAKSIRRPSIDQADEYCTVEQISNALV
jgi:hypothetical protein